MSSEIRTDGYVDLREYIVSTDGWRYLAVLDETGAIAAVYDIYLRGGWSPASANPLTAAVPVSGTDGEIDAPLEVSGTALLKAETDGLADSMHHDSHGASNVIVDGQGTVVLQHTVEVPEQ